MTVVAPSMDRIVRAGAAVRLPSAVLWVAALGLLLSMTVGCGDDNGAKPTPGDVIVVRPDGTGDYPTVQAAIDASNDGDTVELTDGTFTGDGNRDIDFRGKAITVRSNSGNPAACIIDCEADSLNPHRGFYFHLGEGPESILSGLQVMNGNATRLGGYSLGGGVACLDGASPTIQDCMFLGNTVQYFTSGDGEFIGLGGGLYCALSSSLTLTNCLFVGNSASIGGGIYSSDASVSASNCMFTDNVAEGGGGISCAFGTLTLTACAFANNVGQSLYNGGGGLSLVETSADLLGCVFVGNVSRAWGGALNLISCSPSLTKCTFVGNSAPEGGGLRCAGNSQPSLSSTIIAFTVSGGAIYCDNNPGPCTPALACCDLYGNTGGDWVGCISDQYGQNGNISADPLFCDQESGNFHLQPASPCSPDSSACGQIGAWPVECE